SGRRRPPGTDPPAGGGGSPGVRPSSYPVPLEGPMTSHHRCIMTDEISSLLDRLKTTPPPHDPDLRASYDEAMRLVKRGAEIALHGATAPRGDEGEDPLAAITRALGTVAPERAEQRAARGERWASLYERLDAFAWIRALDWTRVPE